MSVRMADVLRFIQNTHNVTDLETIRAEVDFYLTLAVTRCATSSHMRCIERQWRPMLTAEQMVTDGEPWDDISDPTCAVVDGAPWSDICEVVR